MTIIGCHWRSAEMSNEELALKSTEFAVRLQRVDPLLSEIGLVGDKDGLEHMLKAPLVSALSEQDWNDLFDAERRKSGFICVSYWNRHPVENGYLCYSITVNENHNGNGITVMDLPRAINNPRCISGIVEAAVDVFGVSEVSVFTLWLSEPRGWSKRHWRLWLRDGEPWPSGPRSLDEAQGSHASAEPWLGGTLYTWPEYEPWTYRAVEML